MLGWSRVRHLAMLLLLVLLAVPMAASAAPKGKRRPAPARPPLSRPVPAQPALLPVALAPVTMTAPLVAVKRTELEEWQQRQAKTNFEQSQSKRLTIYEGVGDSRVAFAIDRNIVVTPAPRMQEYLQLLANELLGCWKAPRPPIRIVVVARADPYLRAYGTGLIEVSAGSLKSVPNTDALAFLLAHELAHVIKEDEARLDGMTKTLVKMLTLATSGAMYANEVVIDDSGKGPAIGFRKDFDSAELMIATYGGQALMGDVFGQIIGAKQEFDADRLAFDLVNCASRDAVNAYNRAIGQLHDAERPPLEKIKQAALFASIYLGQQLLQTRSGDSDWLRLAKGVGFLAMRGSADQIADMISKAVDAKLSAKERGDEVTAYVEKVYGTPPRGAEKKEQAFPGLKQEAAWTELQALVEGNRALDEKMSEVLLPRAQAEKLAATKAAVAEKAAAKQAAAEKAAAKEAGGAKPATASEGAVAAAEAPKPLTFEDLVAASAGYRTDPRLPNSYLVLGMVRQFKGDRAGARALLEAGAGHDWASREHLLRVGALEARDGDRAALERTIARAEGRMGKAPNVLPLKVWRAVAADDVAQAETLSAQCLIKGGLELYERCTAGLTWDPLCAPRSPEGKAKMEEAVLGKQVEGLLSITGMVGNLLGSKSKLETRCAAAANVAATETDK